MRHLSLFSGVGGFDLGFERAGMTTVGQVENDSYCVKVLEKHWPDVPRWGDIREVGPKELPDHDVLSAGFPCQPTSLAGKRRHDSDERWLWPEVRRLVGMARWVVLENPTGILDLGFTDIADGLAAEGYDFAWQVLSACEFGAPHARERVFIVAHAGSFPTGLAQSLHSGPCREVSEFQSGEVVRRDDATGGAERGLTGGRLDAWAEVVGWVSSQPLIQGVDDGIPNRMDRERALGNAVVPQVAEWVGRRIMEAA